MNFKLPLLVVKDVNYKKVQGVFITHLPQTSLPTLFGQLPESSV